MFNVDAAMLLFAKPLNDVYNRVSRTKDEIDSVQKIQFEEGANYYETWRYFKQ
ncbi:hypothetical protein [Paenibacillus eucommiae]|uniref:Uncharacterized protein n=1 Tax=Paenibacillus eucommiae TaxID=1355755 RepID=A0ABS4J2H8_9BACL|nr:hypothetical protein [Paenibacillus eucommiae]MBP1994042.1 hypothetical protein [Paenibacillus eucommiae]